MLPLSPVLDWGALTVFLVCLFTVYRLVPLVAIDFVEEQRRKARIRRLWRA